MQRSTGAAKARPSPACGPVFMKEFSDHLSSARMMVLMLFVIAFGALTVAPSLTELRNVTESDPFLFLRIFTSALEPRAVFLHGGARLHRFRCWRSAWASTRSTASSIAARCRASCRSRSIATRCCSGNSWAGSPRWPSALVALWLIVLGAGLLLLGIPPRGVEVARGVGFLLVAIAYGGVWLAASMLFSVIFRSTATSALVRAGRVAVLPDRVAADRAHHRGRLRLARRDVGPGIDRRDAGLDPVPIVPRPAVAQHPVRRGGDRPAQSRDPHARPHHARARCTGRSWARRCPSGRACC